MCPTATAGERRLSGKIGPNALTQFVVPLEQIGGPRLCARLLDEAGIAALPDMSGLIDEAPVARFHSLIRHELPGKAQTLCQAAGTGTANYILAHRIPKPAQQILKILPGAVSGPLLARAIAKNAWTFAGSGSFRIASYRPVVFCLKDNPLIAGEAAGHPLCAWHSAVFARLFQVLVDPNVRVTETACSAAGAPFCRFELHRCNSRAIQPERLFQENRDQTTC